MMKPPLQLDRSFFTEVRVDANPGHTPGRAPVSVTARQALGVLAEDGSRWQVDLFVEVDAQPDEPAPPYTVRLHSVGLFAFPPSGHSEEEKAQIVAITGTSILYSQAREYLFLLTSRGPWGAFQLPTVSFIDVATPGDEHDKGAARQETPTKTPRAGKRKTPGAPRRGKAQRARKS